MSSPVVNNSTLQGRFGTLPIESPGLYLDHLIARLRVTNPAQWPAAFGIWKRAMSVPRMSIPKIDEERLDALIVAARVWA